MLLCGQAHICKRTFVRSEVVHSVPSGQAAQSLSKKAKSDLPDVARNGVNWTELWRAQVGVVEGSEITNHELSENKGFRSEDPPSILLAELGLSASIRNYGDV